MVPDNKHGEIEPIQVNKILHVNMAVAIIMSQQNKR
jgi:hypothetical protein